MLVKYLKFFNPSTRNRSITIKYYNYLNYWLRLFCRFNKRGSGRSNSGTITVRGRRSSSRFLVPKIYYHDVGMTPFLKYNLLYNEFTRKLFVSVITEDNFKFVLPATQTTTIGDFDDSVDSVIRIYAADGMHLYVSDIIYYLGVSDQLFLFDLSELTSSRAFSYLPFLRNGITTNFGFLIKQTLQTRKAAAHVCWGPYQRDTSMTSSQVGYLLELLGLNSKFTFTRSELPVYLVNAPYFIKFSNIVKYMSAGPVYARSPGTFAIKVKAVKTQKLLKCIMPSSQIIFFKKQTLVLLGVNYDATKKHFLPGKAGISFIHGRRPITRGVAMNPVDHPNGGRTKTCQPEKSPWGWAAKRSK